MLSPVLCLQSLSVSLTLFVVNASRPPFSHEVIRKKLDPEANSYNPFYSLAVLDSIFLHRALNISGLDPTQLTDHEAFLECIIDKVLPCLTQLPGLPDLSFTE